MHTLAPNAVRLILRACPRRVWSHTKLFTLLERASLPFNTPIESPRKLTAAPASTPVLKTRVQIPSVPASAHNNPAIYPTIA
jgi:hypothetical protein